MDSVRVNEKIIWEIYWISLWGTCKFNEIFMFIRPSMCLGTPICKPLAQTVCMSYIIIREKI